MVAHIPSIIFNYKLYQICFLFDMHIWRILLKDQFVESNLSKDGNPTNKFLSIWIFLNL